MSRRALIIGINNYQYINPLGGCVNDALQVQHVLEKHANEDEEKNFTVETRIAQSETVLTKSFIKDRIEELFRDSREISLLYFSGHGYMEASGGYLITSECKKRR